jgi:hypothetical protein
MQHAFNQEIQAEPRFPEIYQDKVRDSYYTPLEKSLVVKPSEREKEALRQKWLADRNMPLETEKEALRKEKLGLSRDQSIGFNDVTRNASFVAQYDKLVSMQKSISQTPEHGPVVQTVEKKSSPDDVKYGNFWGRTCFTATGKKQTGYFLIDGWLVVSLPKDLKENRYEINDDTDITVTVKLDEGPDPVATKIALYIQDWLMQKNGKLLTVSGASVAGATFFSMLAPRDLDVNANLAVQLVGLAFVVGCIAMYAMVFYSGVKLYQLHCFRDKMHSIRNLGDWVVQIRRSAVDYPDLFVKAPSCIGEKFFTSDERSAVTDIDRMNADTSVSGYVRRFFSRNSRFPLRSTKV